MSSSTISYDHGRYTLVMTPAQFASLMTLCESAVRAEIDPDMTAMHLAYAGNRLLARLGSPTPPVLLGPGGRYRRGWPDPFPATTAPDPAVTRELIGGEPAAAIAELAPAGQP